MNDQASALRQMVQTIKQQRTHRSGEGARVVCVTSGKGGVGKTSFTVNLAIALSMRGLRTLIVDADFGLANVDVMMGVTPALDLSHVIRHQKDITDVIMDAPGGVKIISGGSGMAELMNLSETQLAKMVDNLLSLDDIADVILFDTGAGVNPNIMRIITSSDEVIVVTTPEPTAIMDAYALVKSVATAESTVRIRLVVNKAESAAEGQDTLVKFAGVVRLYLKTELETIGYVLADPSASKAVKLQRPFMLSSPKSRVARDLEAVAWKFMDLEHEAGGKAGIRGFLGRLMR